MKTLLVLLAVSAFLAVEVSAQEQAPGFGPEQLPVRWIDYLSEFEKIEIGRKLIEQERQRLETTGELYQEMPPRKISIPVSFLPLKPASIEGRSGAENTSGASTPGGGGNISCNINTQNPHAGSGPGGTIVVKAKSSGTCQYDHVYGQPPPTVGWDLMMMLMDYASNPNRLGIPMITTATHTRNGLNVTWSSSSAQVFSGGCVNGTYFHGDVVWVLPPPNWTYSGPQPITIPNGKGAVIGGC